MATKRQRLPRIKRVSSARLLRAVRHGDTEISLQWQTTTWPPALRELHETLLDSRSILNWEDDWDGEGAPAYAEGTWTCAANLLTQLAIGAYETFGIVLPTPTILAGPGGSFDLHWKLPQKELLINVAPGEDGKLRFYGDNRSGSFSIEGHLDPSMSNLWLVLWLVKL